MFKSCLRKVSLPEWFQAPTAPLCACETLKNAEIFTGKIPATPQQAQGTTKGWVRQTDGILNPLCRYPWLYYSNPNPPPFWQHCLSARDRSLESISWLCSFMATRTAAPGLTEMTRRKALCFAQEAQS